LKTLRVREGPQKTIQEVGCSSAEGRSWRQGEEEPGKAGFEGRRKTKENEHKIEVD